MPILASLAGFEPATCCLEGSRSVQLSYRDNPLCSNVTFRRKRGQVLLVSVQLRRRSPQAISGQTNQGNAGDNGSYPAEQSQAGDNNPSSDHSDGN